VGVAGGADPRTALAAVFIGCIVLDTLITNIASAVFMFPIAMALAANLGVDFLRISTISHGTLPLSLRINRSIHRFLT
jgi:di/tricarboxylate transporter